MNLSLVGSVYFFFPFPSCLLLDVPGLLNGVPFPEFDAFCCGFRDFLSVTYLFFPENSAMCGSIFDRLLDLDSGLEILSGFFSYV